MTLVQELYSEQIRSLDSSDQLRLATMILQGLTAAEAMSAECYNDDWSEEDRRDLAAFSLRNADEAGGKE
jgi:hypothetical protein